MEEVGVSAMISPAAEMDIEVELNVSLVQELEIVASEIKMDDNEAGEGSVMESRPIQLFLDYYVSDDFKVFKLPPKKRKSAAWISRIPDQELRDGTIAPPNTPEGLEDGTITPPNTSEELEEGIIIPPNIPEKLVDGTILPPDMPDNLKRKIYTMNGTRLLLVVQKPLTTTDIKEHQNRLQIPFNQMSDESHNFLNGDEKDFLDYRDEKRHWNRIDTSLLDLQLNSWNIPLRKWVMNKKSGDGTEVYVLNSPWIDIVRKNGLKAGDDIQVWSFRVGDQLHLALVKMDD